MFWTAFFQWEMTNSLTPLWVSASVPVHQHLQQIDAGSYRICSLQHDLDGQSIAEVQNKKLISERTENQKKKVKKKS